MISIYEDSPHKRHLQSCSFMCFSLRILRRKYLKIHTKKDLHNKINNLKVRFNLNKFWHQHIIIVYENLLIVIIIIKEYHITKTFGRPCFHLYSCAASFWNKTFCFKLGLKLFSFCHFRWIKLRKLRKQYYHLILSMH